MAKVRVHNFTVSLDGFGAGPNQRVGHGLGDGGEQLHEWAFRTPTAGRAFGMDVSEAVEGVDDDFWKRGDEGIGATLMGRNMFGPVRGEWDSDPELADWKGWWGPEPPYHHPVVVLTHHARDPIPMEGGTTFHFVTAGLEAGLQQALDAAGGKDVRVGGGVSTVQQLLRARLIDELHVAISPVFLGSGERLFDTDYPGYDVAEMVAGDRVFHVVLRRG
jgi:dihydrofolate reductase